MGEKLFKVFYGFFAILFGWMFVQLIYAKTGDGTSRIQLIGLILLVAAVLVLVSLLIQRLQSFLERFGGYVLVAFLVVMGTIQLVAGFRLRYTPMWDIEAIYQGAIDWVETGSFSSFYDYFYWFPNNLGGMGFLFIFFWIAHKLGITDYFGVALVLNCVLSLGTIFVTSAVCRRLAGVKGQFLVLVLFAISLPFYFLAPVFYTDVLTMLFPISIYFFYCKAKEQKSLARTVLYGALMGVFALIGMEIKFTVMIMLIAVLIDALCNVHIKKIVAIAIPVVCVVLLGSVSFQESIYSSHLDKEIAKQRNTPYLHWVMMGLTDSGSYDPADYEFTRSFTDTQERDKAILQEITNRIQARGWKGMVDHLTYKGTIILGAGTYDLDEFLDDEPANPNPLHSFLLGDGEKHMQYERYCLAVLIAVYLLMLLSAVKDIFAEDAVSWKEIAPRMAFFGLFLFLIFWEARGRYITNYIPVLFVCGIQGLDWLGQFFGKKNKKKSSKNNKKQ